MTFIRCSSVDLDEIEYSEINFYDLPDTVQSVYVNIIESGEPWHKDYTINLDSKVRKIKHEDKSIVGVAPGKKIFTIKEKEFTLDWNANSSTPPYILHQNIFYFKYMGVYENDDLKEDNSHIKFRRIDLTEYLTD